MPRKRPKTFKEKLIDRKDKREISKHVGKNTVTSFILRGKAIRESRWGGFWSPERKYYIPPESEKKLGDMRGRFYKHGIPLPFMRKTRVRDGIDKNILNKYIKKQHIAAFKESKEYHEIKTEKRIIPSKENAEEYIEKIKEWERFKPPDTYKVGDTVSAGLMRRAVESHMEENKAVRRPGWIRRGIKRLASRRPAQELELKFEEVEVPAKRPKDRKLEEFGLELKRKKSPFEDEELFEIEKPKTLEPEGKLTRKQRKEQEREGALIDFEKELRLLKEKNGKIERMDLIRLGKEKRFKRIDAWLDGDRIKEKLAAEARIKEEERGAIGENLKLLMKEIAEEHKKYGKMREETIDLFKQDDRFEHFNIRDLANSYGIEQKQKLEAEGQSLRNFYDDLDKEFKEHGKIREETRETLLEKYTSLQAERLVTSYEQTMDKSIHERVDRVIKEAKKPGKKKTPRKRKPKLEPSQMTPEEIAIIKKISLHRGLLERIDKQHITEAKKIYRKYGAEQMVGKEERNRITKLRKALKKLGKTIDETKGDHYKATENERAEVWGALKDVSKHTPIKPVLGKAIPGSPKGFRGKRKELEQAVELVVKGGKEEVPKGTTGWVTHERLTKKEHKEKVNHALRQLDKGEARLLANRLLKSTQRK